VSTGGTILLIMSDGARSATFEEYLRLAGVDVQMAESGLHALTQLERLLPDAIVSDAQLEDMSGSELMEILRSDVQFGEVVFLLLGQQETAAFGPLDAAIPGEPQPADVLRELRPILSQTATAARSVRGTLSTLGLDGVLNVLAQSRRTGVLHVETLSCASDVWIQDGQAVNAKYGILQGEKALVRLLAGTQVLVNADYHFEHAKLDGVGQVISTPLATLVQRARHDLLARELTRIQNQER